MADRCVVVGVLDNGVDGMAENTLKVLLAADVVIAAERTLKLFKNNLSPTALVHDLKGSLSKVPQWIEQAQQDNLRVVVLATGDPLCHGIAKYLAKKLGSDKLEIMPNVSMIQIACARRGIAWQAMKICSVHTRDAGEWLPGADPSHGLYQLLQTLRHDDQLAVFTSPDNTPDRIARMLVSEGMGELFTITVAAKLLCDDEVIDVFNSAAQMVSRSFVDPNVMLFERKQPQAAKVLFGLEDQSYKQRKPEKGLITKREVRAVSLARMQLHIDSVVWDIGAGSGSVGLEAAQLARRGHVYAIEKNQVDAEIALENKKQLGISNYSLINSKAPDGLDGFPDPDAIFIGGSGGELTTLISYCLQRLNDGGCLVMNFVTLENIAIATQILKDINAEWDVVQLNASRSKPILHMHRMAAENPVWIVCARAESVTGDGDE